MRNVALWLHILGASMWIGTNVAQMLIGPRLVNDGAGLQWLKAVEKASGPIYGSASVLILLTGIYLVLSNDAFSFGSTFVGIGIAVLIIGGRLGRTGVQPEDPSGDRTLRKRRLGQGAAGLQVDRLVGSSRHRSGGVRGAGDGLQVGRLNPLFL